MAGLADAAPADDDAAVADTTGVPGDVGSVDETEGEKEERALGGGVRWSVPGVDGVVTEGVEEARRL